MSDYRKDIQTIPLSGRGGSAGADKMPKASRSRSVKKRRRRKRRMRLIKKGIGFLILICLLWAGGTRLLPWALAGSERERSQNQDRKAPPIEQKESSLEAGTDQTFGYPPELSELLEKNGETADFVKNYSNRAEYINQEIDLKDDAASGKVPLLMQWDKRWGYNQYGKELIGLAGCGPTCMAMAYIYLTGDLEMNPRRMAEYAYEGGFYTTSGTSWSMWTEGAQGLGLSGYEISLDENVIKSHLDQGELVVMSMGPGDFTTTGHFILICGYDGNGFFINDPNRKTNSEKQWDFETLRYQVKCLWAIGR